MAPNALARAGLLGLLLGLAACGGKKKEEPQTLDFAAIRARRDSIRQVAIQDSVAIARYTTCSDSVVAVLAKKARGKKAKPAPAGVIAPEVLQTCGRPPAVQVAKAQKSDSGAQGGKASADSANKAPGAAADTAAKVAATAPDSTLKKVGAKADTSAQESGWQG